MEFTADTTWKHVYEYAAFFKKVREGGNSDIPTDMLSTKDLLLGQLN